MTETTGKHRPTVEEAYEAMVELYDADECGDTNTPEFARNKNIVMAFMEDRAKEAGIHVR